ncbi:MAG TPA: amino acid adenylation domain-containing protein [Ktedonobacteraceae bacterium]|nr:amino acid adenylation domain-containing protein [Ktedonobacteraceae bacterium]
MNTLSSYESRLSEHARLSLASFSQQRLWFLQQWNPEQSHAITSFILSIDGPLHREALEHSLNKIVQRHEILRTTFAFLEGHLTQVIAPSLTFPLPVCDLQHFPEGEWMPYVQREVQHMASQSFDLAHGPLLRVALLRCAQERHFLIFLAHQGIIDAQSRDIFLQELATFYRAYVTDRPSSVSTPPLQYTDFALQQQEWVGRQDALAPHLAYWQHLLDRAPAVLDLPMSHSTRTTVTDHGGAHQFALPAKLREALNGLCRQDDVELFTPLLAAFAALLSRYSGQDDFCLGSSSGKRSWPGTETLIGNFVNTLMLRVDLSGDPTFQELVARIHTMVTASCAHANVPFEYVMKELHLEHHGQNAPFQVFFALEPSVSSLPPGWSLLPIQGETEHAQFDLSLVLTEYPEGLHGCVEYRTDLFDAATIERLVGHWLTLLEAAVLQPAQRLALLPMITEAERQQAVVAWNATQAPYPRDTPLHQLFEEQVARTPAATAVSFATQQLTYGDLNAQANRLAHALREKGVGPDTLVGIFVERSLDMVVGLLGILKAGGAYVPLDPTYPSDRISFMLEDAQTAVLVTQSHLMSHLPAHTASVVCLDADADWLQQQPTTNPSPVNTVDHLAYVIYTSGSTGRPKGVQLCHRSVVNFMISMRQQPGLSPEDRLLAVTTLSFDIAGLEIYLPLITGAQVIIASSAMVSDGAALAQTIAQERITVMQATPITWRILLASGWQGSPQLRVFCGGEALPLDLAQQLRAKVAALWNLYGPTETTIWSAAQAIQPEDERISIGRPIANTEFYLLDPNLQLVPIGVPGELFIGGDGLARGYLRRPELTQERFIAHPFQHEAGARLYRTGDLAYYQPDGTIVVMGRLDHQVKVRGFRIELGEIEAVISQYPSVQQVVVVVREDTPGDSRLVAYVVPQAQEQLVRENLHQYVQEHLPAYMLPYTYVVMEAFPLTLNGKIDRRALPAPEASRQEEASTFVAPETFLQQQLVTLWEDLLQVRPLGIRDNFFEMGGHSFLAMRLVERIEQAYGKKLPLSTLFAEATVEHVAQVLQQEESGEVQPETRTPWFAVQADGTKRPFFFLHGQWEGGAFYSLELARALGSDQPFYLLDTYRFVEEEMPPTIEEMATAHLDVLRRLQPEGPYQFGGWCNGGLIGYEMARQLRAQGQRVDLLVLMDADAPGFRFREERRCIDRLIARLRLNPQKQVDWFLRYRHMRLFLYDLKLYVRNVLASRPQPEDADDMSWAACWKRFFLSKKALRQDWLGVYEWAAAGYQPSAYPEKVTFFWTQEEPWRKNKWSPWITRNELDIHIIPGNHITSRTRYLSVLAEHLRSSMQSISE